MGKYKPNKNELFAKGSSLAIGIYKDSKFDFDFHVYDRKTRRIIYSGSIPLVTLKDYICLEPIKKSTPKRKQIPLKKTKGASCNE